MRKALWTLRAALHYMRRVFVSFPIAWELACGLAETYDWREEGPIDAVEEDLTCWSD